MTLQRQQKRHRLASSCSAFLRLIRWGTCVLRTLSETPALYLHSTCSCTLVAPDFLHLGYYTVYGPSDCQSQCSKTQIPLVSSHHDTPGHDVATYWSNMADGDRRAVLARTSLVVCAPSFSGTYLEKVRCQPQSTLWRRPWTRVVRMAPVALVVTNVASCCPTSATQHVMTGRDSICRVVSWRDATRGILAILTTYSDAASVRPTSEFGKLLEKWEDQLFCKTMNNPHRMLCTSYTSSTIHDIPTSSPKTSHSYQY